MAENEFHEIQLEDNFYRDCFTKVIMIAISLLFGIVLMIVMAVYIQIYKPSPKVFLTGDEWRILPPVPVDQPYLSTAELSQWVMDVASKVFVLDFNKYDSQVAVLQPYFTNDGWQIFLNQLNIYANNKKVLSEKMFVSGEPAGAPIVTNEGLQAGRYVWLIQVPIDLSYVYAGNIRGSQSQTLTLQLTIVRVPTLNNLKGVAIDNVEVVKSTEIQQGSNNANGQ